jgi:2,3-bisphosphoglycerate-independent phosphoglycerate mutase
MSLIFIFIDGLGLGPRQQSNPLYTTKIPNLSQLLRGKPLTIESLGEHYESASLLGLDAGLGVDGLPQSATGQASLFTGKNAAKLLGYHLRGFPNQKLRESLAKEGMFLQLQQKSFSGTFANAYRPQFFAELEKGLKRYHSCTTFMTCYAGLRFRDLEDLKEGQAVYMDITNELLNGKGFSLPPITPQEAGERLVNIAKNYDLTLYEHFLTDIVGHSGDFEAASKIIKTLDKFIGAILENIDPGKDLLFITSDHGNLENMKVRVHTYNPVPALVVGKNHRQLVPLLQKTNDITGVLPALMEYLCVEASLCR